jgi:hypothetical protein
MGKEPFYVGNRRDRLMHMLILLGLCITGIISIMFLLDWIRGRK